jgi:isopropanol dehydrogenase (NADP+)
MKAFVMKKIGQVGFVEKPVPRPGPGDAIVKTSVALVCTSDSHTVHGAIGPRENLTLGHEAVGIVSEVGSGVKRFKPGDRVVVGAITPDWGDPYSQAGHPTESGPLMSLGGWKFANIKDGVFAEYFHVNEADANMAPIPLNLPNEVAVYCPDMLSTGFVCAENGHIPLGGTVAVFGEGPVGMMATAGSKLQGAGLIIGVETVPRRQELARLYGADVIVDFAKEDVVQRIMDLTDGQGVDTALEVVGDPVAFQNAIKVTKPGGTISDIGYYHGNGGSLQIPLTEWGFGMAEKTIMTGLCPGGSLRMKRLLRLLESKRLDPTCMTSHTFPFDQVEQAYEMMDKKLDGVIKPLIVFP